MKRSFDILAIALYIVFVLSGIALIYAADYEYGQTRGFYEFALRSGKQGVWVLCSGILILLIALVSFRIYDSFAYVMYALCTVLLILVLVFGKEVAGSRSWLALGTWQVQPSEFAKYATLLALAKLLSGTSFRINSLKGQCMCYALVGLPTLLVVLQGDLGTALVFSCLLFVTYRAGMNPMVLFLLFYFVLMFVLVLLVSKWVLLVWLVALCLLALALAGKNYRYMLFIASFGVITTVFIMSLNAAMTSFLRPYQYERIQAMVNPGADPLGYGWNVTQSKIAIGAGGLRGKGYLKGTQTKLDFVPEKSTDFIFCTLSEEFGWIGAATLVVLFVLFIWRLITIAERQNTRFALFLGYGTAAIFFFHFTINIAMTIGLFPVIGIPLPFISYGGSSLWAFTIMLFTLLKLDKERHATPSRF